MYKKKLPDGREIKIYEEHEIRRRKAKKKSRTNTLDSVINDLIDTVSSDMGKSDEAAAVALILCTYERVGNEASASDGHYGVSNLLRKHITEVHPREIVLEYVGKSGVSHRKSVKEPLLVKLLSKRTTPKNQRIFDTTPQKINEYLKNFGITSKDIRTYAANKFMSLAANPRMTKKEINESLREVAGIIGHKPATLKSMYLHDDVRKRLWGK